MRAVVLQKSCSPSEMKITHIERPRVQPGWVLIRIMAFGLNHSEIVLRRYEVDAEYIQKPIIPGIECVGIIENPSDSRFHKGVKVVALMGGMGRSFHGSYAEFVLAPASHVFTVSADMDWSDMAAVPETFFTAYGSLVESLKLQKTDILLVHGATSALGYAAVQLGKSMGCTVIGTTRKQERLKILQNVGADYALLDQAELPSEIRHLFPGGISKVLELIGPSAIPSYGSLIKKDGIICVTGQLGGSSVASFDLIKGIPNAVYLTSFYSNAPDQAVMDHIFATIEDKHIRPVIGKVFPFDEIAKAHDCMEKGNANGKIVIRIER